MKRKPEHETQCIRSESEVPAGYVPMLDFGDSTSYQYKRLSKAQQEGVVRAVKLVRTTKDFVGGRVWVHEADARSHLLVPTKPEPPRQHALNADAGIDRRHAERVCESLASMELTLDEIYRVLERLATAVESIATQPKAQPAGSWRDMNGESL